jgi:hypothetical protein
MDIIEAAPVATSASVDIDPAAEETARRYIDAIVARDILGGVLGTTYRDAEAERLWGVFTARFSAVTTGAYAKPRREAFRIALAGI